MYGSNATRGKYTPKYPAKYKGDPRNIVYRSSWELKFMNFCDTRANVVFWNSEELIIPYRSPVDGKMHRYFVDFQMVVRNADGTNTTFVVEVKPSRFCSAPAIPKRKTNKYIAEVCQWGVNSAKWAAAREYCLDRGFKFVIITEHHLNIKR